MLAIPWVTVGTIPTVPGAAPMRGARRFPSTTGSSHHPSAHARTPRVRHCSA